MLGLEKDGYNLYTDNYYTSPMLHLELYKKGVNARGMMQVNRKGFPTELVHIRKDEVREFQWGRGKHP